MSETWDSILTAWRLAEAGRWEEALAMCEPGSQLVEVIGFRSRSTIVSKLPVIEGWSAYYQADYRAAREHFIRQDGGGWLKAWAELGLAKVASDCGRWQAGLLWCARAWRTAADGEHLDLLAEISGARGEILLRAGRTGDASAGFTEDLGLLTPGSRYRGRVRCYQAHAWSRMGPDGVTAAKLAYRISAHSPGESATNSFAIAGLALLAARVQDAASLSEAARFPQSGLAGFWIAVAQARLAQTREASQQFQHEALSLLPDYYFAERWWLSGWMHGETQEREPAAILALAAADYPSPERMDWTAVELPVPAEKVGDAPWLHPPEFWPKDSESWWSLRDTFMP